MKHGTKDEMILWLRNAHVRKLFLAEICKAIDERAGQCFADRRLVDAQAVMALCDWLHDRFAPSLKAQILDLSQRIEEAHLNEGPSPESTTQRNE